MRTEVEEEEDRRMLSPRSDDEGERFGGVGAYEVSEKKKSNGSIKKKPTATVSSVMGRKSKNEVAGQGKEPTVSLVEAQMKTAFEELQVVKDIEEGKVNVQSITNDYKRDDAMAQLDSNRILRATLRELKAVEDVKIAVLKREAVEGKQWLLSLRGTDENFAKACNETIARKRQELSSAAMDIRRKPHDRQRSRELLEFFTRFMTADDVSDFLDGFDDELAQVT